MSKAKVSVRTSNYEATWGAKPRGRGHWAFRIVFPNWEAKFDWAGSYTAAKEAATARAASLGASLVVVMP